MYWTGVLVWCAIGVYLLSLAYIAGRGLAIAVDWLRWRLAINRASGLPLNWKSIARAFGRRWVEFTVSPTASSFYGQYGCWEGYRRWSVYERSSSAPSA
jgi:uncharacterized membrane protein (Fun14 family)